LHQVRRKPADEDEGDRQHANQQGRLDPGQHAREHAGHVQPGAIQRRGAGGHAANHRNQAYRQEEPARRHGQQAADIVVRGDVVRRLDRDDGGGGEAEQERDQRRQLRGDHRQHDPALRRLTRDVARPVAEERPEGNRVAHRHQRRADECRPEPGLTQRHAAGILAVESRGEGEDAEQEQQARGPHGDAVDPQHDAETVDAHGQHQQREQAVGQAQSQVGFRQIDEAFGAADQRITRAPH